MKKDSIFSRREFLTRGSKAAGGALWLGGAAALLKANAASATKPGRKIRIGQIGTAHAHAKGKMQALRKLKNDFEVVGIVEPDQHRRKEAEKEAAYHELRWMSEQELFESSGLEAVAVETEVCELVPTGMRCIGAGKHIHLDKAAGESLTAFGKLLDEAGRRGLCVQMGYMFRHNPAFRFCFEAVRSGWLGEVLEVHGVIGKTLGDSQRKELARYRGGTMFNLGCHLIDAMVTVLGKPEKVTAYTRRTREKQDNLADNQLAVFEYRNAIATIRSAAIDVEGGKRRQFAVYGDKGNVVILPLEPPRLQLTLSSPRGQYKSGTQNVELPAMPGRYDDQLIEFARIISDQKQPECSAAHDLAVHEALILASGLTLD